MKINYFSFFQFKCLIILWRRRLIELILSDDFIINGELMGHEKIDLLVDLIWGHSMALYVIPLRLHLFPLCIIRLELVGISSTVWFLFVWLRDSKFYSVLLEMGPCSETFISRVSDGSSLDWDVIEFNST